MNNDTDRPRGGREASETSAEPLRLPLEAEQPIPYALTARARRVVAPDDVPDLQVVEAKPESLVVEDDLDDPRSVQARALRRAGMPVSAIAGRLEVDPFTVRAWLGGRLAPMGIVAGDPDEDAGHDPPDTDAMEVLEDRGMEPDFSGGLAVLGALADVDGAAVVLASDRPAPLAQGLAFLRKEFGVEDEQVRVVLRLGSFLAGDRAIADWSAALGLPPDRFRHVRSGRVAVPDGIEVLVRVTGSAMADRVSTWLHRHQLAWRPSARESEAPAS